MPTTNFPTSLDDNSSMPNPGTGNFTNNPSHAGQHDIVNDAVKALEAKIGIGASTPGSGKVFRGTSSGVSSWGALVLTTDVTGVLPVANGGTGVTTSTGTGNVVLSSSPTIVTPTIASLTNAQHDHASAGGGGALGNASVTTQMAQLTLIGADGSTVNPIPSSEADIASSSQTFIVNTASYAIIVVSTTIQINTANDAFVYLNVDGSNQSRYIQAEAPSTLGGPRWTGSRIFKVALASGSHTIKLRCSATAASISVAYDPSWYGILVSQ